MTKKCKTCDEIKNYEDFALHSRYPSGRHYRCFKCQEIKKQERKDKKKIYGQQLKNDQNFKEKQKAYHKKRYILKKDHITAINKKYDETHKAERYIAYLERTEGLFRNRRKRYGPFNHRVCGACNQDKDLSRYTRDNNNYISFGFTYICRSCMKIRRKERYNKYAEKSREYCRNYRTNNSEAFQKSQAKHRQSEKYKKRKNLPKNRIIKSTSTYISRILRLSGHSKVKGSMLYVGCNKDFFTEHLYYQFSDGMMPQNYGKGRSKWVVDHYVPLEAFDLTDPIQHDTAFHWTNLQPKWWASNSIKIDIMPDGRRARETKHEYALIDLKKMIYERVKLMNLPYATKENLPSDYEEILNTNRKVCQNQI